MSLNVNRSVTDQFYRYKMPRILAKVGINAFIGSRVWSLSAIHSLPFAHWSTCVRSLFGSAWVMTTCKVSWIPFELFQFNCSMDGWLSNGRTMPEVTSQIYQIDSILKRVVPILTFVFSTLNWLTLALRHILYNFTSKLLFYFLSWGKNKYVTLGMRLLWKFIIRKSKLVYQNRYIFCYNFQSIVNLKLKFWGYNKKKYGLSFDLKKYYFRLSPGGWECNRNISLISNKHLKGVLDKYNIYLCISNSVEYLESNQYR